MPDTGESWRICRRVTAVQRTSPLTADRLASFNRFRCTRRIPKLRNHHSQSPPVELRHRSLVTRESLHCKSTMSRVDFLSLKRSRTPATLQMTSTLAPTCFPGIQLCQLRNPQILQATKLGNTSKSSYVCSSHGYLHALLCKSKVYCSLIALPLRVAAPASLSYR